MTFISYLSGLLPLVRVHEYRIVQGLLDGVKTYREMEDYLAEVIPGFERRELDHALEFIEGVRRENDVLQLDVPLDDQFREYLEDLIQYGLTKYVIDIGDEKRFKLWMNYRMDQVQLKLLKNPGSNQVGTYYYDDFVVIFASLKKDMEEADKLNYKDKFLQPDLFQWESMNRLPQTHLEKLKSSMFAYVFIRKVESEYGLTLPHIYVGKGRMEYIGKAEGNHGSYLFDIHMENELPDYLQYDFGLKRD